jgi:uncharacterized paraquat-inducible protein A
VELLANAGSIAVGSSSDLGGQMPGKRLSADEARAKGLCEKCQEKPLSTMHYCADCMTQIRERKRANLAKRQGSS